MLLSGWCDLVELVGCRGVAAALIVYASRWGLVDLFIVEFILGVPRWGAHVTGQVEMEKEKENHTPRVLLVSIHQISRHRRLSCRSTTLEK
jgi:hypothetical protein